MDINVPYNYYSDSSKLAECPPGNYFQPEDIGQSLGFEDSLANPPILAVCEMRNTISIEIPQGYEINLQKILEVIYKLDPNWWKFPYLDSEKAHAVLYPNHFNHRDYEPVIQAGSIITANLDENDEVVFERSTWHQIIGDDLYTMTKDEFINAVRLAIELSGTNPIPMEGEMDPWIIFALMTAIAVVPGFPTFIQYVNNKPPKQKSE